MENQQDNKKINGSQTQTRDAQTDITAGASDTSNIDAAKQNALENTDTAGTELADIYGVLKGEHPNNEENIKKLADGVNPLISDI